MLQHCDTNRKRAENTLFQTIPCQQSTMDIRGQSQTNQGQDSAHHQNFNSFSFHLDSHRGLLSLSEVDCPANCAGTLHWIFAGSWVVTSCSAAMLCCILCPKSSATRVFEAIRCCILLHSAALTHFDVELCDLKEPVLRDLSTQDFGWVSVACARPVALKQCLGLPKPLWHEAGKIGKGHAENSEKHFKRYSKDAMMETPFPGDGTLWR